MKYKVLIVDDELLIREGLRRHIDWAMLGMEVTGVADSAERALAMAEQQPPDVLITDICMRGKDGFDLIEDLLELGISPQVLLISSYNDFVYAQRAVRLSVVREYILKPVDTDQLCSILLQLRQSMDKQSALLEHSADTQMISVEKYRDFLRRVRMNGYDRHQLIQYIKTGNTEQTERLWQAAQQVAADDETSLSVVSRFCSSLLMTLISEGIFIGRDLNDNDPVLDLERMSEKNQMLDYLWKMIQSESADASLRAYSTQSKLIVTCLQVIDREYCNANFNLTVLAAELNVTPNYLSVRFKEELGIGFMKYLLEKQMEKAKLLLGDPSYKVYQISDMVGFQDEKYFSRQFKKIEGVTPKDYRNNHTSSV